MGPAEMGTAAASAEVQGGTAGQAVTMSYAELDQRASALAALLLARGIGRGDRVGIVAGRSPAVIVAVWGVLKAGATYPDARISQLLADSGARLGLPRDLLAAGQDLPGERAAPVLRREDQTGAEAAGNGDLRRP
jgi:non-ribosomal peptide synthetase component F